MWFLSPGSRDKRVAAIRSAVRRYSAQPQSEESVHEERLIAASPRTTPVRRMDAARGAKAKLRTDALAATGRVLLKPLRLRVFCRRGTSDTDYI
jgi:hypothetical protein